MKYRIRLNKTVIGTAYVSDSQWDAAWFSRYPGEAKTWKSRAWAERWLACRPEVVTYMDPVIEEVSA